MQFKSYIKTEMNTTKHCFALLMAGCYAFAAQATLTPERLRCEYQDNPLAVEAAKPLLSWRLAARDGERNQRQTACQILVASSPEILASDQGDLWDSGKGVSDRSVQVEYAGKPLNSIQPCYWKLRVWDKDGVPSGWSAPAAWTMGILRPEDWQAKWIAMPIDKANPNAAFWIRKEFSLDAVSERALAFVNSQGYCELWINGQKVGEDVLSPGVSVRSRYNTYDVACLLRTGKNCIGLWVGKGWGDTRVRAQMELSVGGKPSTVETDRSWLAKESVRSHIGKWSWGDYGGERVDARLEVSQWSEPGCDTKTWKPTYEIDIHETGPVAAQTCPPNRIGATLPLVSCAKLTNGVYELDFGTNLSGWLCLRLPRLKTGQKVTIHYADKRFQNSSGDDTPAGHVAAIGAKVFVGPLGPVGYQTFKQTDEFPHVAPLGSGGGGPEWGGLGCVIPWKMYVYYGDRRLLERSYDAMCRYTEFLESHCSNNVLRAFGGKWDRLGDWVPPRRGMDTNNWPPERAAECFNNCYRLLLIEQLAKAADALGKQDEAERWRARIAELRPIIHAAFYDPEKGIYVLDEQAYFMMPLLASVTPADLRENVAKRLEDRILAKSGGHFETGLLGTYFLIQYLENAGRDDLLFTLFNQTTYPGWGYMLSQGATTMWEQWNGYFSQIHACFACPSGWFFQGLAGIRPDECGPGFKKFVVKPSVVGDLTWVKCHHDSLYGRIVSNWQRTDDTLDMEVKIPPNTTATVYVPAKAESAVRESGKPVNEVKELHFLRMENGAAVFEVGSGSYRFASQLPSKSDSTLK